MAQRAAHAFAYYLCIPDDDVDFDIQVCVFPQRCVLLRFRTNSHRSSSDLNPQKPATSWELFYPRDWWATTVDQFIEVVDSYIRCYNVKRIKVSLGSLSPIEYRQSLGFAA